MVEDVLRSYMYIHELCSWRGSILTNPGLLVWFEYACIQRLQPPLYSDHCMMCVKTDLYKQKPNDK